MSTATNNNGTQRKQLSDQLDRLDGILDGLAEALNGAVADAVRGVISLAVSEAVHAAVREVLCSPDLLRAALEKHAPTPASEPKPPTLKENVAGITNKMCDEVKYGASLAKKKLTEVWTSATKVASHVPTLIKTLPKRAWASRKPFTIAVGVGVACATACYFGGQLFSSIANGLSGATITLSAMTLPVRRLFYGNKS